MYAGPKPPPVPSALSIEDPDARRELQALADLRREDQKMAAYEGVAEFGPIARTKEDRDWDAMERDSVYVYWSEQ